MSHELLTALRERTHGLHQELDHHPMMAVLLQPGLTAAAYANTLAWLHPLQSELEHQLAQRLAADAPFIALASRLPALEHDLQQLEMAPNKLPSTDTTTLLIASAPATPTSVGALAGMLYVLNGARLGSGHIARRLQHTSPHLPCRYFREADGATHWPPTLKLLDHIPSYEYSDCIAAAEQVFQRYIQVLSYAHQESACQMNIGCS